jgi:ribosomal protein L37AE/L43A
MFGVRRKQSQKETFEEFASQRSDRSCPLCGSTDLKPLFDDYLECSQCKHIFSKPKGREYLEKPLSACPLCGSKDYNILFEDNVECKNCKWMYRLRESK